MNYPGAIVITAGLIAGALLLSSQVSSQSATGRYQIGGVAQSGQASWRVDSVRLDLGPGDRRGVRRRGSRAGSPPTARRWRRADSWPLTHIVSNVYDEPDT